MNHCAFFVCFLGGLLAVASAHEVKSRPKEEAAPPSARYTSTVKLVEDALPAAASIRTFQQSGTAGVFNMGVGSASVIHADGYLLTNDHVVSGVAQGEVILLGRPPFPFKTIATMSSEDMALIKVEAGEPLDVLRLGRSHDLMLGEPVLTIGNPSGLTHSVSTGIVSGLNRSTAIVDSFLPSMIQTSAAVSGGNSGGPLINAVGDQIGIVTSKKLDGENINFAIAVDRVREVFPVLLSAELRYGFRLGIEVDMYTTVAEVTSVTKGSPAEKAGIEGGDVIQSLNTKPVRSGIDFHLGLIGRTAGEKLTVGIKRGTEVVVTEAELAELEQAEPIPDEGMIAGLAFEGFDGKWDQLPDFDGLKSVKRGRAETPTAEAYKTASGENYALRFVGFLKIPREGFYTFYTSSDDGSRFKIGGEVVVNNDGLHGVLQSGGVARLREGLHPVEVTFFEQGGDEKLEVSWEGPEMKREVIPAEAWFVREEEKTGSQSP